MTETVEGTPDWLAVSDVEFQRGYVVAPEQVPRLYAFFRHPALIGEGVPGPSGPLVWGMRLPGGDLVTVVPSPSGGTGVLHGTSIEALDRRLGRRLDAELLWLPRAVDTTLGNEGPV